MPSIRFQAGYCVEFAMLVRLLPDAPTTAMAVSPTATKSFHDTEQLRTSRERKIPFPST